MVDSIFKQIFDQFSKDTSFTEKKTNKKSSSTKIPLILGLIDKWRKSVDVKDSNDLKRIGKQLEKGRDIEVNNLVSKRYHEKGSSKESLDEYSGELTKDIPSTAIKDVNYNPQTGELWLRYKNPKGGSKQYHFVNVSPSQFESFMRASSKGRYAQYVLRPKNHDPAYPVTLRREK